MSETETINKHLRKLRKIIGKCLRCGSNTKCEFVHLRDTPILEKPWVKEKYGRSRGNKGRFYDILKHLSDYSYLCRSCHNLFDHHREHFEELPKPLSDFVIAVFKASKFSSFVAIGQ